MIERATHSDNRFAGRARGTVSGLAFGVGHGGFTDQFARMISKPKRYVTKPQSLWNGAQARFLNRQLSLPVSTMSQ